MGQLSPLLKQVTGITVSRGQGCYLYDEGGRPYLDFTSGIGVVSTGHCHPRVVEAIRRQAGELLHGQYTTVLHPRLLELCQALGEVTPEGIDTFFFASAGTEAIEAALRLCRQATGRPNVIVFQGSFHGRTVGALSMTTSKVAYRAGVQPLMPGVFVAPFPHAYRYGWSEEEATAFCLRELEYLFVTQTAPQETAAIVVEPVLGEGGYVPAPPAFLRGLRERADRHGILMVVDEIQAGVGRTGRFWAHEWADIVPDLLVTAKGLASGLPISAFGAPASLMERGWPGSQGGTYGGNVVACAAALATLEVIREEGLVGQAAEVGAYLIGRLREVAADHPVIGDVRGQGLMVATELGRDGTPASDLAGEVMARAADAGLLLLPCGPHGNVIRWAPPLVVGREEVDQAVEIFAGALVQTV